MSTVNEQFITRLAVNIGPETSACLDREMARSGVTLTEALRRLVGVGDVVVTHAKDQGAQIIARTDDWTREIEVLF